MTGADTRILDSAPVKAYKIAITERTEMSEDTKDYALPVPELPELAMPEAPKVGQPESGLHMSCEGEVDKPSVDNSQVVPPEPGKPRILIGIPILSYTHEFVQSFLKFWQQICVQEKGKMQVGYQFIYRRPVHMAEIELVKIAQFNKCTHLLLMDDDIYDVTLDDLHKLLKADKDVISGHMYASKFPFASCAFRRYDVNKKVIDMPSDNTMYRLYEIPCTCSKCGMGLSHWDALFCPACGTPQDNIIQKVDLIPFPFTLIKMTVFDKLKKPWFHCTENYPSDSWFADRCIEAGIQEWVHMGVRLNHNGITDQTKQYQMQMNLEKNRATGKGLVELSQEEMDKHQFLLHQKMKEAEHKVKTRPEFIETMDPQKEGVEHVSA